MQKRVTFRHMDHSDMIEAHVEKKMRKIDEFLSHEPTPISVDLVMEPSKTKQHHRIELRIKTPHYDKIVHHEVSGDEFYQALDHVIDTMYKELCEAKKKLKNRLHNQ